MGALKHQSSRGTQPFQADRALESPTQSGRESARWSSARHGFSSRASAVLNDVAEGMAAEEAPKDGLPRSDTAKNYSEEVMKQYKVGPLLGFGSFGVVHEVASRKDGRTFAMKMVDLSASDMDEVELEAEILQLVRHERLTVGCMDLCHDACFFYIVMPIYRGGDLT